MEIALALLAALAILIGYQFYMKHTASSNRVEEVKPEIKEEVVAEVKAVEVEVETKAEVAEVKKAAKVKTAAKKVAVAEEVVTAAKKTVKKPKIKIAK